MTTNTIETSAKTMNLSTLHNKIIAANREAREWCKGHFGRVAHVMIDTDDGAIWTDVFLDCNEFKQYHSSTIESVSSWCRSSCWGGTTYNADMISTAVELLTDAGWQII